MRIVPAALLLVSLLGVGVGSFWGVKRKRFRCLYLSLALLLVAGILFWCLPVTRLLQKVPDAQVAYVHLLYPTETTFDFEATALTEEEQAAFLAAVRETDFSHEWFVSKGVSEEDAYYHLVICADGDFWNVDLYVAADGTARRAFVTTGAPWRYRAADPEPLVRLVTAAAAARGGTLS